MYVMLIILISKRNELIQMRQTTKLIKRTENDG